MSTDYDYLLRKNAEVIKDQKLEPAILDVLHALRGDEITPVAIRAIGDFIYHGIGILTSIATGQEEKKISGRNLLAAYRSQSLPPAFKLGPDAEDDFVDAYSQCVDGGMCVPTVNKATAVRMLDGTRYSSDAITFAQVYSLYLIRQVIADAIEEANSSTEGVINGSVVELVTE